MISFCHGTNHYHLVQLYDDAAAEGVININISKNSYLIHFINSPSHVDFLNEVIAALFVT